MSAYQSRFIAVVQVNNQTLREKDGVVYIPFGTEYSILMKNLSSRRALVSVSIDGRDVLGGHRLIVDANAERLLERFVENLDSGRRFKFVHKSKEVVKARGDKIDDGFIRIEFAFEKTLPKVEKVERHVYHEHHYDYWWPRDIPLVPYWPEPRWTWTCTSTPVQTQCLNEAKIGSSIGQQSSEVVSCNFMCTGEVPTSAPAAEEGITVRGSESEQKFMQALSFECDTPEEPIIIRICGVVGGSVKVEKPITTKSKLVCPECKKSHKSHANFCSRCGSALSLT
jgi:hypothetical protein